jgi:hypothetical protein
MMQLCVFLIAVVLSLAGRVASAQDVSRYRVYALDSSLESVTRAIGVGAADAKTLHERPARIQELEWRAPYVSRGSEMADPVEDITFTFCDDALYQIVVRYDRDRTDGLTNTDIMEALSSVYGVPVPRSAKGGPGRPAAAPPDAIVLAQWETAASSLTLLRDSYLTEYQLILVSKVLSVRARSAIREAMRLDVIEAPRRESEQRKKEAADASTASNKARMTNKAAFRP